MTLRLLSALFSKFSGGKVLEIGAGTGYWAYNLARYKNQVTVVEDGRESLEPGWCKVATADNPMKVHYPVSAAQFIASDPLWFNSGGLFLCWPRPSEEMTEVVRLYGGKLIIVIGLHDNDETRGLTLDVDTILLEHPAKWQKRQGLDIPLARWPHVHDTVQVWTRK